MFPETAGKTLEEVEELFTDPHGPRYVGTPAWKTHITTKRVELMEKGDLEGGKNATFHHDRYSAERSSSEKA